MKARRALRALKGIVMLQAVIRGQNVRKQATITLRCMQALLRVQSRVHDQRSRLSHDGSRKSVMSENATGWESKYHQDVRERKSMVSAIQRLPDEIHILYKDKNISQTCLVNYRNKFFVLLKLHLFFILILQTYMLTNVSTWLFLYETFKKGFSQ